MSLSSYVYEKNFNIYNKIDKTFAPILQKKRLINLKLFDEDQQKNICWIFTFLR